MLKIENLAYTYKSKYQTVKALKGITYEFQPGKFYALIGRSGSGKTTLLSLLAALDIPTEGTVTYQGKPLRNWIATYIIEIRWQSIIRATICCLCCR